MARRRFVRRPSQIRFQLGEGALDWIEVRAPSDRRDGRPGFRIQIRRPLYRQAQIYARQGVDLDRSTLVDWVGRAAFLLPRVHERPFFWQKRSGKLLLTRRQRRRSIQDGGEPRPGSFGLIRETTGPGAAPIRPASPTSIRQAAGWTGCSPML
jgi:hypothetical protein